MITEIERSIVNGIRTTLFFFNRRYYVMVYDTTTTMRLFYRAYKNIEQARTIYNSKI